jgi:hypothetical protein
MKELLIYLIAAITIIGLTAGFIYGDLNRFELDEKPLEIS